MLDRKLHDEILSLAHSALSDRGDADEPYTEIILRLKQSLANNQKEMASALQTIAREIEAAGRVEEAFAFKQRTCAVMLQMSMAERHGGRQLSPSAAQAGSAAMPQPAAQPTPRAIRSPFRALYFTSE